MIKVYTGTMFAGKSTALINEYMKLKDTSKTFAFKPSKDKRDKTEIRARNVKTKIPAVVISEFDDIEEYFKRNNIHNVDNIFIDEIQFIEGNYNILNILSVDCNVNIYVSGLKQKDNLEPFGCMPNILAIADEINVLKTNCECGNTALYTQCIVEKTEDILIGDAKEYKPVCRDCYINNK